MELPTIKRRQAGFTLIELLIVIAIIAILIAIGLASYSRVQKSARDSQRRADLHNVAGALEQFYSDWNSYPFSSSAYKGKILVFDTTDCAYSGTGTATVLSWGGTAAFSCNGKTYLSQLPKDPLQTASSSSPSYYYKSCSPATAIRAQSYTLFAKLEAATESPPTPTCGPKPSGYNYLINSQ